MKKQTAVFLVVISLLNIFSSCATVYTNNSSLLKGKCAEKLKYYDTGWEFKIVDDVSNEYVSVDHPDMVKLLLSEPKSGDLYMKFVNVKKDYEVTKWFSVGTFAVFVGAIVVLLAQYAAGDSDIRPIITGLISGIVSLLSAVPAIFLQADANAKLNDTLKEYNSSCGY